MNCGGTTMVCPSMVTTYCPLRFAFSMARCALAISSGASPCRGGATRSLKMRGELTIAACSGCASGTLMTSMRKSAEFGFTSGVSRTQPGSSFGERMPAEPEMYTYTFSRSFGSSSTVCVCDPRQVCTLPTFRGCRMSLMSKMRRPRRRSVLTVSRTPCAPQSRRPVSPSPDTKRRLP